MQSKKSELAPFIEKPLKVLKSLSKGELLESNHSLNLHSTSTPILVSSALLRSHQCGQVDIATYDHNQLIVYEVKSSPEHTSKKQIARLKRSVGFIASALNSEGKLVVIK